MRERGQLRQSLYQNRIDGWRSSLNWSSSSQYGGQNPEQARSSANLAHSITLLNLLIFTFETGRSMTGLSTLTTTMVLFTLPLGMNVVVCELCHVRTKISLQK